MEIKVMDGQGVPEIGGKMCYLKESKTVENAENDIKHYMQYRNIKIKDDGGWVDAEDYFSDDEQKSTTVTAEIEVEDDSDENNSDEGDYNELFEGHWKKQVANVKEYDDIQKVEEILDYALNNDVSDAVIERVEDYLAELEG